MDKIPPQEVATDIEIAEFMAALTRKASKASWFGAPVSSQVLADLCLEKRVTLPRLHEYWYSNAQEVKNYLEILLDRFFREGSEHVLGNIVFRREFRFVSESPGVFTQRKFYLLKRR